MQGPPRRSSTSSKTISRSTSTSLLLNFRSRSGFFTGFVVLMNIIRSCFRFFNGQSWAVDGRIAASPLFGEVEVYETQILPFMFSLGNLFFIFFLARSAAPEYTVAPLYSFYIFLQKSVISVHQKIIHYIQYLFYIYSIHYIWYILSFIIYRICICKAQFNYHLHTQI